MHISLTKVLVAATACVLATACTGGTPESSDDGGDPQSLSFLIEQQEDADALDALREHIAADFTEESGITVDVEALPLENMRTVLQTQLRSGEGPDVFNWGSGPSYAGTLAEAGLLYDLTDAYEQQGWPVYDFAKEQVTFDGTTYGVPGELETIGIFYNRDVFSELGIEQPESVEDLTAASQQILDSGLVPMAVSDREAWQGGHLLSMTLSSDIGSEGVEALINGEASWDSPEVVSALQLWQGYNEAGYLPPSPTSLNYDGGNALFFSGEAAMLPTGSWLVPEIEANTDFEVGYIPFPAPDGAGIFTGGLGSGPFISVGTSKTEAALEFLDFLASPEHGRWTVENLGVIPPIPVDTENVDVSPLFVQVLEDTATFSDGGDFGHNIDVRATETFNQAMFDGFQAILTGQRTAEEVAADLQAASQT